MRVCGVLTAVLAVTVALAACTPPTTPASRRAPSAPAARAAGHSGVVRAAGHPRTVHRPVGSQAAAAAGPTARPTVRRTPPPVAGPGPCRNGAVAVSAARGGALPGEEVALLIFTNRSASACTLTGFPGVELLGDDSVIGHPATRSSLPVRTLQLTPGANVTARLIDDSRCDAPLSDTVGVYVPNQTVQLHTALQLRGCALTIDPVRS